MVEAKNKTRIVAQHLRLYVLADKLQVLRLLPLMVHCICSGWKRGFRHLNLSKEIEYIFSNSERSSELRLMLAEAMEHSFVELRTSYDLFRCKLEKSFEEVPEFALDMCGALGDAYAAGKDFKDPLDIRSYLVRMEGFKESQDKPGPAIGSSDTLASWSTSLPERPLHLDNC